MAERSSVFTEDFDVTDFTAKKPATEKPRLPDDELRAISERANFPSREAPKKTVQVPSPASALPQTSPIPSSSPYRPPGAQTQPAQPAVEKLTPRQQKRLHRTGRSFQFNTKLTAEAHRLIYEISDKQGWVLGETIENALHALKRELDGQL